VLESVETPIKLEVLDDLTQLLTGFDSEWSQFYAGAPQATPFQSPEWLLTWWRHFGSGQLQIFTFRDEDKRLIGVIPCFLHKWNGRRQLTLVGSGISDYLEPLIDAIHRTPVLQRFEAYLRSTDAWDICSWQDLSADSALADIAGKGELGIQRKPDTPCLEIPLSRNFDEYWQARPSGLRRNVKRYSQKAAELATLNFEHSACYEPEYMEALIRLHGLRWREHGEQGMINANRSGQFLRDVCQAFAGKKKLSFFVLRFQGVIAAVILGFSQRKELFAYLSAFDPAYGAFGFGRILLYQALRHASCTGYSSWNFLRGDEPYKAEWGATPIKKLRVIVTRYGEAS
jgi:CelD/BcsL family acetyltransferase involved in cellulose biosynthesis